MDQQPNVFVPIEARPPGIEGSAQWSGLREVTPLIDRPAPLLWRALFHGACDASPDLDWMGAGFARCRPDDVARVVQRLQDITDSTNAAFATHVGEAEPEERYRLMNDGINFEGEPGASYMIPFP